MPPMVLVEEDAMMVLTDTVVADARMPTLLLVLLEMGCHLRSMCLSVELGGGSVLEREVWPRSENERKNGRAPKVKMKVRGKGRRKKEPFQ